MYTFALLFLAFFASSSYGQFNGESNHLVTMKKEELMKIINCVSTSLNVTLCEKFKGCENREPDVVVDALFKCRSDKGGRRECNTELPLFDSPETPSMIFDCIANSTRGKLTPGDRAIMRNFEVCSRYLYRHYC